MVNLVRHKARDVGVHCGEEESPELPLNTQASQLSHSLESRKTEPQPNDQKLSKPPADPRTSDAASLIWTGKGIPRAAYTPGLDESPETPEETLKGKWTTSEKRKNRKRMGEG